MQPVKELRIVFFLHIINFQLSSTTTHAPDAKHKATIEGHFLSLSLALN